MSTVTENIRIVTGNGDVMEYGFLKYEGDIIVEVGAGKLSGDIYIDGSHKTMILGLFDCHVHLGMEVPENGKGADPDNEMEFGVRPIRQCLESPKHGVTCVRNVSTELDGDLTVRDVLEQEHCPVIRILASGGAIPIMGGHGDLAEGFDSTDEVLSEARWKIKKNMDVIKLVVIDGMATRASKPGNVQYSVEELKPAMDEARTCGRIIGIHCTSLPGARNAILAGVRSIEHAQLDEETVELMVQRQEQEGEIPYRPTLTTRYSILHNVNLELAWLKAKVKPGDMKRKMNAVRLYHEGGIPICVFTDTNAPFVYIGDILDEIALYMECGSSEMEAISTATRDVVRFCMLDGITGTLEMGKRADFVTLSESPLDDIRNLKLVEMTCRDGQVLYEKRA